MTNIAAPKKPIPMPEDGHPDRNQNIAYVRRKIGGKYKRRQIGTLADPEGKTIYPNNTHFPEYYPDLWKQYTGEMTLPLHLIHMGRYVAGLALGLTTGIYPLLVEKLQPLRANAFVDYAMFSIGEQSGATYLFEDVMKDQLTFAGTVYSDSWYSKLFLENSADAEHQVKLGWIEKNKKGQGRKAILCVDGSNNDCDVQDSDLAEPGNNKSHTQKNIVGFICAVDAEDGTPVTWDVNPGGKVDVKTANRIINRLAASGFEIECAVMDRGFVSDELLDHLDKKGISHVLMLRSDCRAHQVLMEKHAQLLNQKNLDNLVDPKGIFGVADHEQIFAGSSRQECVGLFYDCVRGAHRAVHLIKKVYDAKHEIEARIAEGKDASVPNNLQKYLEIQKIEKKLEAVIKPRLQKDINAKGFFSIASSKQRTAQNIHLTYGKRDCSEKQYSAMKSHMGADATNVHADKSINTKMFCVFVGTVLRNALEQTCKKLGLDTTRIIKELDRCNMEIQANGKYEFYDDLSTEIKSFFKELGVAPKHFEYIAEAYNQEHATGLRNDIRSLPVIDEAPRKPGPKPKPRKPDDPNKPKRGPGRPKGSKNKSTLAREAREAREAKEREEAGLPPIPKRGPGRPKGSKNKSTERRLARKDRERRRANGEEIRRGRPKGSKNKSTLAKEALLKQLAEETAESQPENTVSAQTADFLKASETKSDCAVEPTISSVKTVLRKKTGTDGALSHSENHSVSTQKRRGT